ncbi:MAG: VIT domain-containing protein [Gemmataceae bacterium]
MRKSLLTFVVALFVGTTLTTFVPAAGILIPKEKKVPPLAMVNHLVTVDIEDQVATTQVQQTFRNHTDRALEATYIFPVPKGASVKKFTMWVGDKEVAGELLPAKKARKIYTDIVRRTQDPGLLEHIGNNLFQVRVFPVPANGEQKIRLSYSSICTSENDLVRFVYPLKTDGKAIRTLEKFSVQVNLKSQHPLQNIYSPTHAVTITRKNDNQAQVVFEKAQGLLDRNFFLYYSANPGDVGLTTITHRPESDIKGHFMLLVSPRADLSKAQQVPRDIVFVLDTSSSMRGKRIEQAQKALTYCIEHLGPNDRFSIVQFATGVNKYSHEFLEITDGNITRATRWINNLKAAGGTAIDRALETALSMRSKDATRNFTMVFFTDGLPTIGERNPDVILKNFLKRNTDNTRLFTFGVGNNVNASLLDQLAEKSRALTTYVQEGEQINAKVASLYNKINKPVLANLKLTVSPNVKLADIYPQRLPDLFHGTQLVVLGRYEGHGKAKIKLVGQVGKEERDFHYTIAFPEKTPEPKPFVEDLWARRKVGYLLDQIRLNGEQKELVEEVVALAKRHGITTPYTSWLVVPDAPVPVVRRPVDPKRPDVHFNLGPAASASAPVPPGLTGGSGSGAPGGAKNPQKVYEFARQVQKDTKAAFDSRRKLAEASINKSINELAKAKKEGKLGTAKSNNKSGKRKSSDQTHGYYTPHFKALQRAQTQLETYREAEDALRKRAWSVLQNGRVGVNLSIDTNNLRNQCQLTQTATRRVQDRNCLEIGGVWIDEAFNAKLKAVTVKAMSKAYFRILERHPVVRDVYRLGNHVVWVTPSGKALVIDLGHGEEEMSDAEIDALFKKKKE